MSTHELAKLLLEFSDEEIYVENRKILKVEKVDTCVKDESHPDYKPFVYDPNRVADLGTEFMSNIQWPMSYNEQWKEWYVNTPKVKVVNIFIQRSDDDED